MGHLPSFHHIYSSVFLFTNLQHICKEQISANPFFRPVGFCISSIGDRTIHIINPLSLNSGQDQFSPSNIHTLSRDTLWE